MSEAEASSIDVVAVRRIAEQAKGRCHSCIHSRRFDMPSGTRFWCRAFNAELTPEQHQQIRSCPRWSAFCPVEPRTPGVAANALLRGLIDGEDLLFWRLKQHLDSRGLDLKTVVAIAHPGTDPGRDLTWVDGLDVRFGDQEPWPLAQVLGQMRALGYQSLAAMIDRIVKAHTPVPDRETEA